MRAFLPVTARRETKSRGKSDAGVSKVRLDVVSAFVWIETEF